MAKKQILEENGVQDLSAEDVKRLDLLREAIRLKARLQIRYNRFLRTIFVHRIWLQDDGSYLIEAFQQGGGSAWGGPDGGGGESGFVASPYGGWQGWILLEFERIESIQSAGRTFRPRDDFNPNPKKSLGKVIAQVEE